jgi:hypothetical protein
MHVNVTGKRYKFVIYRVSFEQSDVYIPTRLTTMNERMNELMQ